MSWVAQPTTGSYFTVFHNAINNDTSFRMFKLQGAFLRPVGVTEAAAVPQMMKTIGTLDIEPYKINDSMAHPVERMYGLGTDTIRFIETTCIMSREFGDMTGKSICEMGSNYGGLALCMLTRWPNITSYSLVDYPIIQDFAFHYLTKHGVNTNNISLGEPDEPFDYFIAEYSLTEQRPMEAMIDMWKSYEPLIKTGGIIRCNIPERDREMLFINTVRESFEVSVIEEAIIRRPNKVLILKR